jgi:ring-1,2-phenylacetyl-CoA epoxidase subunit PaaD
VAAVVDPELRVLTIEELGILRDVTESADGVSVTITPTYSGCPALDAIRSDIEAALSSGGFGRARVSTVLSPPWTTDMITPAGRAKLTAAGIAPPPARDRAAAAGLGGPVPLGLPGRRPECPLCASADTEEISRFGSTACKALWRCRTCLEPFEQVKPL